MKKTPEIIKSVGNDIDKPPMLGQHGRILKNHALMYILEGNGSFEDEHTPRCNVSSGTVFYLYPNRWHKFDPDAGTIWTEYWILFNGNVAERCFGPLLPDKKVIYNIGLQDEIIDAYEELFDLWILNAPPNPQQLSYLAHSILFQTYMKINNIHIRRQDDHIAKAKSRMKYAILQGNLFDPLEFAEQAEISYESFRKHFKQTTGMSPNQYVLRMKINRAKSLLLRPNLTVKDIAERLGIDDPYYFSRLFKSKTGLSPSQFRQSMISPH